MKCPYNRKSETHYQCWAQKYDEGSQSPEGGSQIDQYIFELEDCLKQEIGRAHV